MNRLESAISTMDYLLSTKRKRHIVGGILMSASLLFVGVAFTVLTLKPELEKEDKNEYEQRIIE